MSLVNTSSYEASVESRWLVRNLLMQLAVLFLGFCSLVLVNIVQAEDEMLSIERSWIREAPPGVPTLAAYMTITNNFESSLTIIGVSSNVSTLAEIHEVKMDNEVMQMRRMTEIIINPGQRLELKPSSTHVMLMGVQQSLKHGDEVEIKFELKGYPAFKTTVPVKQDL